MFIIVRHGNTFEAGEPPRRIGARTDLPLTAASLAQGHALSAHFAGQGWRFARVLVSPLTRTRETECAILSHQLPDAIVTPKPCDWLREIDHGPDEDRSEDAVLARIGAARFALRAAGLAVTGGLDVADWGRRP
jgi:probable phosphoglycerate mutase